MSGSSSAFEPPSRPIRFWRPEIPPHVLKEVHARSDSIAFRDLALRLGIQAGLIWLLYALHSRGDWALFAAVLLVHGFAWSFLGWAGYGHELSHWTAFKSRPLNEFLFVAFSIFSWLNYGYYRRSHIRHHQSTLFRRHDGEGKNNLRLGGWINILFAATIDLPYMKRTITIILQNARGDIGGSWGGYLYPPGSSEREQVIRSARVVLGMNLAFHALAITSGLWLLSLIVFLGPFTCTLPNKILASLQHFDGKLDTPDFRENTHTVVLPRWLSFLYSNMNYHVEHHLVPGVPYYNLPKLHEYLTSNEFLADTRTGDLIPSILSRP